MFGQTNFGACLMAYPQNEEYNGTEDIGLVPPSHVRSHQQAVDGEGH